MTLLEKLIFEEQITKEDIYYELSEMCDRVHSRCNDNCLVFYYNDGVPEDVDGNCICFKSGEAMYHMIRSDT